MLINGRRQGDTRGSTVWWDTAVQLESAHKYGGLPYLYKELKGISIN